MDLNDLVRSSSAVVTVAEAADLLGVDVRTVSRAMNNGDLPALRVGRRLLIPRLPLMAYLGVETDGPAGSGSAIAS
ncbi:helix-turn-helix domain-containing protein [Klenkia sesuvii]|uniref:helix-turn-helix domain-containing protein n=1 Tax=Klenkia sesuvii TaxID=3103137 RepID=UPI003D783F5D